ncbi:TRAP transporter substrate-binding protein DctP [Flaviflexus equikiangi]|uniref:TRAP transporter substrate-binding protein DctP n=1 Tax=Flaviflexus equikiangi TaxID=2758573 RepID=A0ABS2TGC0_9ACTO|nr:TRAP transporter substrate-binding protein DctP [Flaviflexus equikiangi]MBM9433699.1 TRAP transporter substrate-binding protein DctP [Flaviflexus equikiangi]
MIRNRWSAALAMSVVLGSAAACSDDGADYVLHYTTYSSATSDQSRSAQRWAEEVERLTDGGVSVVFHYSQSLVGADEAVQATLDGRADLAQVGSIYAASDLSMFTVIELPFETKNPQAHMNTILRLYEESPVYREDFDRQGVRLLFPLPLGTIAMGLNEPAQTPDDLAGRSIRSGGLASEVLLTSKVNPVAMTATDIYESMERGIVDGYTALALANLSTFGLTKASPYVVDPGIGAYSSSIVVINEDLYQSMPEEYQRALDEASRKGIEFGLEEMESAGRIACEELTAAGTEFSSFSDADVAAWAEKSTIADEWVARYAERGYDAASVLDDYRAIIADEESASDYEDPLVACMEGTL